MSTFSNVDHRQGGTGGKIENLTVDVSCIAIQIAELTQAVRELKFTVNQAPVTIEVPDFDVPAPVVNVTPSSPPIELKPQITLNEAPPVVTVQTHYPIAPLVIVGVINAITLVGLLVKVLIGG